MLGVKREVWRGVSGVMGRSERSGGKEMNRCGAREREELLGGAEGGGDARLIEQHLQRRGPSAHLSLHLQPKGGVAGGRTHLASKPRPPLLPLLSPGA